MKLYHRLLALLLTLCMLCTLAPAAVATSHVGITAEKDLSAPSVELKEAVQSAQEEQKGNVTISRIENPGVELSGATDALQQVETVEDQAFAADEIVTVIVVLEEAGLLDSHSKADIAANLTAVADDHAVMISQQEAVLSAISATVGQTVTAGYHYSVTMNAISVDVPYGKLPEIEALEGVTAAFVAPVYDLPEDVENETADPAMYATKETFGSALTWQNAGYTGAGMRIAIFDTGLDLDHPSFSASPEMKDSCLTEEEVASVVTNLNAAARYEQVYGMELTAQDLYYNEKVPYGFNYADNSLKITHEFDSQGDHGTHVSGIAAANGLDSTSVVGVAPDAQILVMKVFGTYSGASFDDILAGLEDCFWLNVDVVNMSLGSPAGFSTSGMAYVDSVYEKISQSDMIAAIAAGNSTSAAYMNGYGTDRNLTSDPDNSIISSPATWPGVTSVASMQNQSVMSYYLLAGDRQVVYNDIALYPMFALEGEQSYVMVPGYGTEEDFAALDVAGKIAVVSRGEIAFTDKQTNAYNAGAIACIVYDNVDGDLLNMQDAGLLPNAFISKADGELLASLAVDGQGTIEILGSDALVAVPSSTAGQISDFSSWGVTPDLQLSPDVTAPGGSIYSTIDNGKYGTYDGTSMACPHIAGMAALVLQYLREEHSDLTDAQMHTVAEALIMSTAIPVMESETAEYSPRKQGAGSANVYRAVTSGAYLSVDGGKPKVSMGDDDAKTGKYSFSFEINNFSAEDRIYVLDASVLTDEVNLDYADYGYYFMGETSRKLGADVVISAGEGALEDLYDVNGDGLCDLTDVQALLDGVNGLQSLPETDAFDLNEDGILDTADVQTLYELVIAGNGVRVKANSSLTVEVEITLTEEDVAYIEAYYPNGIYIDGFVRAYAAQEEGVDLCLPFLGFYGDWSDSRIFDGGWYYEEYMEANRYANVLWTEYGESWYYLGDNPYIAEEYDPAHNVLSPNGDGYWESVTEIYLSMMRNAREITFTYTNTDTGEVLFTSGAQYVRKSYYISAYGLCYPFIYSDYIYGNYDFTDESGNYLADGTNVTLTITGYLDDGDDVADEVIEVPLHIDTQAPVLYEEEVAYLYNEYADTRRLEFYVSDNYDIAAVVPLTAAGDAFEYIAVEDVAGEKTLISLDVSGYDSEFLIAVCDYGGNESFYAVSFEGEKNYPEDTFYAYRRTAVIPYNGYYYATDGLNGWYSFQDASDMLQHTALYGGDGPAVNAAEYVDGFVIGVDGNNEIFAMKLGDYTRASLGQFCLAGVEYPVLDMAMDINTNTLYVLTDELAAGEGGHLATLDVLTGTATDLGRLTGFAENDSGKSAQGLTLACDNDGLLYSVNHADGALYTIDPATAIATLVGQTGYDPMYLQSMTVDHETNELYWAAYASYTGTSGFFRVDKTTGELTLVSEVDYNGEMTALFKPYETEVYPEDTKLLGLTLSEDKLYTTVGSELKLTALPVPYYADLEQVLWTSDDETIATVSGGTVTALAPGQTVITATVGDLRASCELVVNAYAGDITFYDMGYNYAWFNANVADPADATLIETGAVTNYGFTAGTYANGYVYASDYDNILWKLDPVTLAGQQVGNTGGVLLAMAFNYDDGYMYAVQQAGSFWEVYYYLVRVNLATGETAVVTQIDEYSMGAPIGGMTIDHEGNFYLMFLDYETYLPVLRTFTVTEEEEGAVVTWEENILFENLSFYNYCSLVYSQENDGFFWTDDMGTLYHLDISNPAEPVVVSLGVVGENIGGVWPLAMFMIPQNEPETNWAVPEKVELPASFLILEGSSISTNLSIEPWNAEVSVAYTTADPDVATVTGDGILTGVSEGTTMLAAYVGALDMTLEAEVKVVPAAGWLSGYVLIDMVYYGGDFYANFSDVDPTIAETVATNPYANYEGDEYMTVFAGGYYDGSLYAYMQVMDNYTWTVSYNIGKINLEDYSYEKLAVSPWTVRDMEFDYTTGTMLAMVEGGNIKGALAQVDLQTGEIHLVGDSGIQMITLTVDAQGNVYAISAAGDLYRLDKATGAAAFIGATGASGDIYQSMHYDHNSGNTYWAQADSSYVSSLRLVDLETGCSTNLGKVGGGGAQIVGMYTVPEVTPEIPENVAPTSVSLTEKQTTYVGGTVELSAQVLPVSVSNVDQTLTWSTSDASVATVEDGVVTGLSAGVATITATACNGVKAECLVTITAEERLFYVYDETNTQWISFSAGDTTATTVVRDDAQDEAPIAAAVMAEEAIYAYDSDGLFYTIDGETFQRNYVGQGVSELTIPVEYFSYETWGYETAMLPLTVVDMAYDAQTEKLYVSGLAIEEDLWIINAVIGQVDLATGEIEILVNTSEAQPGNLLVMDGVAYFVDCYTSGMLCSIDLTAEEKRVSQNNLVPGYWGDYNFGRGILMDELTGEVYVIRDLNGGDSILNTLTLSSGAIYGIGTIGEGLIVNSLLLK